MWMDPYCDVEGPPGRNCAIANVLARWLPAARVVAGKKKCCATTRWHQHAKISSLKSTQGPFLVVGWLVVGVT